MSTKSTARSAGMSTESTAPLRTIRMSDQDWNELLITAVNAEYKNRADYIRAVLRSKQPPAEIPHAAPVSAKDLEAEIETYKEKWQASVAAYDKLAVDARSFLSRAEIAEAEIPRLKAEVQAASLGVSPPTILYSRPSMKTILDSWTDKERKEWADNKWKGFTENWCKKTLDTAYSIMDQNT